MSEKEIPKCPHCGATLKTLNVKEKTDNQYYWDDKIGRYGASDGSLEERKIYCPECQEELEEELFRKNW